MYSLILLTKDYEVGLIQNRTYAVLEIKDQKVQVHWTGWFKKTSGQFDFLTRLPQSLLRVSGVGVSAFNFVCIYPKLSAFILRVAVLFLAIRHVRICKSKFHVANGNCIFKELITMRLSPLFLQHAMQSIHARRHPVIIGCFIL